MPLLAAWTPSGFEWIILLIVALLIWGHRLPSMARSLGTSVSEFKKGVKEGELELKKMDATNVNPPAAPVAQTASAVPPATPQASPPAPNAPAPEQK